MAFSNCLGAVCYAFTPTVILNLEQGGHVSHAFSTVILSLKEKDFEGATKQQHDT